MVASLLRGQFAWWPLYTAVNCLAASSRRSVVVTVIISMYFFVIVVSYIYKILLYIVETLICPWQIVRVLYLLSGTNYCGLLLAREVLGLIAGLVNLNIVTNILPRLRCFVEDVPR